MKKQKSYYAKPSDIEKKWHLINADGQILGRLASRVASILRGKTKATYTPSVDVGDFVVVTNAAKIRVTGNKSDDKEYHRHSGYPGGLKTTTFKEQLEKDPTKIIYQAVKGMLPSNRLGRDMLTKVKIYADDVHPHEAQNPTEIKL